MKLQNKIGGLLKNLFKKAYTTSTSTFNAKITTSPTSLETSLEPPMHLFKRKEPYIGTIKSKEQIVGPRALGETYHIVIDHGGNLPYWEGQSYGIIPPGENPNKPNKLNSTRFYSLASTRYGDNFDGQTASLCVRRVVYLDPKTGKEDLAKKGICSNFLCNSMPGDKVQIVGPFGKMLILPEENSAATHIMVATGTGIAPFRAHMRRMFMEDTSFKFNGQAWLFAGVANTDSLLYHDEFLKYMKEYPTRFRYDIALSREQINSTGGKLYVQDKMEEHSKCVLDLLDNEAHIYFCGLKEMMPCVQSMLKRVSESQGENWEMKLAALRKNKQWHVDVY